MTCSARCAGCACRNIAGTYEGKTRREGEEGSEREGRDSGGASVGKKEREGTDLAKESGGGNSRGGGTGRREMYM